jgi:hypothetical protein
LAAVVAVAAGGAVVVTGGAPQARSAPGISAAPSDEADARPGIDAAVLAKLDPRSRDVAISLEPGEWAQAALETSDSRRIVALGRGRGLDRFLSATGPDIVDLRGPVEAILAVVGDPSVSRVSLGEDLRAMRTVAAQVGDERAIPVPGQPYLALALNIDLGPSAIPPARRGPMLTSLARLIVTIDGQPYQHLHIEDWCHGDAPVTCGLEATGSVARSGGQSDAWLVTATAATGWTAILAPEDRPRLNGVPRWLTREAERIARADPAVAQVIAAYQQVDGASWDPNAPGLISVLYSRGCAGHAGRLAAAGGGVIADTGQCFDQLELQVDVPAQRVVGQAVWSDSD